MQASALPPPPPPEAPPVDPGAAPTPVNKVDLMEQAKNRIAELEAEVGVNNLNKNNNKKKKKSLVGHHQVAALRTIKTKVQKLVQN